jgi:hypothetical protein
MVDLHRHATDEMAAQFHELFVNRRAYTLQSMRPHPETGRHYYFRPKSQEGQPPPALDLETSRKHLAGELTLGLYSINPKNQRSKWVAIDADYKNAVEHLLKLQYELTQDGLEPALEKSNSHQLALRLENSGLRAHIVQLPDGHDPNTYFVAGAQAADFTARLREADRL